MSNRASSRSGFTLVEMLVVIGIIGILAAILLPAVAIVRRKVAKATTQATIANLETAIAMFKRDWGEYPPHSYRGGDPKVRFPGTTTAVPRFTDFHLCDNVSEKEYTDRALMYFLTSQFTYKGKSYGPYFTPKEKQFRAGKTTLPSHSVADLTITLWNGEQWTSSQSASAKLVLLDGFSRPFFYYSNKYADRQVAAGYSAVHVPHKPFSYVLFSVGENGKSAWNDGIDNDGDSLIDNADDDEKFIFEASGRSLTSCGKQVGQDQDDIHNW